MKYRCLNTRPPSHFGLRGNARFRPSILAHASRGIAALMVLCSAISGPAFADPDCQIAVMTLKPLGISAENAHIPEVITTTLAASLSSHEVCRIVTQAEISQMMDFEAMKATCAVDSPSCIAEIGGALGVSRVVNGSVATLGSSYKLQINLHNVSTGVVEKRFDRLVAGDAVALDSSAKEAAAVLLDDFIQKNALAKAKQEATQIQTEPETAQSTTESTPVSEGSNAVASEKTGSTPQTESASAPDTPQGATGHVSDGEDAMTLSTGVMAAGALIFVGSAVGLVGGAATGLAASSAIQFSVISGDTKPVARNIALGGFVVAGAGLITAVMGAGISASSFLME